MSETQPFDGETAIEVWDEARRRGDLSDIMEALEGREDGIMALADFCVEN